MGTDAVNLPSLHPSLMRVLSAPGETVNLQKLEKCRFAVAKVSYS
jgi:hypothetical protein